MSVIPFSLLCPHCETGSVNCSAGLVRAVDEAGGWWGQGEAEREVVAFTALTPPLSRLGTLGPRPVVGL